MISSYSYRSGNIMKLGESNSNFGKTWIFHLDFDCVEVHPKGLWEWRMRVGSEK